MKKYISFFLNNENGVELIEFLGIVAIAGVLLVIAMNVGQQMVQTGRSAEGTINGELSEIEAKLGG